MTGTSSTPRWTRPTSAGKVSIFARSPVAPKITSASTLSDMSFLLTNRYDQIAPGAQLASPREGDSAQLPDPGVEGAAGRGSGSGAAPGDGAGGWNSCRLTRRRNT